jgi:hypothetical protein
MFVDSLIYIILNPDSYREKLEILKLEILKF